MGLMEYPCFTRLLKKYRLAYIKKWQPKLSKTRTINWLFVRTINTTSTDFYLVTRKDILILISITFRQLVLSFEERMARVNAAKGGSKKSK